MREKYQIISVVISLSIFFSHHSFIRRRNGVERLCLHPIIEENGWKNDREREREGETVMEQWASRETTTISHFDPLVSLLLLVSFLRRQWCTCVCICIRTTHWEKYENSAMRFDLFYTISIWEIFSGHSLTDKCVYASIDHTQQDHLTFKIDISFHLFSFL